MHNLLFGGGWVGGTPKQFFQQADYFKRRGILAISADYRTKKSHNAQPQDGVRDAKAAIRWVRKNADKLRIDPHKIIASGGSAGGHLALCTGLIDGFESKSSISSKPNAMVVFNPVLDTTRKGYGSEKFGANKTILSPCHQVKKNIVPTLIFHGTKDKIVPYENAKRFTRLMKKQGNKCSLISFKNRGHGFFNGKFFRKSNSNKDYAKTMNKADHFLTEIKILDGTPLPIEEAVTK